MALYVYRVSFPTKIMEAGDERTIIAVSARNLMQAEARALRHAIAADQISDANDWRWQRRRVEEGVPNRDNGDF